MDLANAEINCYPDKVFDFSSERQENTREKERERCFEGRNDDRTVVYSTVARGAYNFSPVSQSACLCVIILS